MADGRDQMECISKLRMDINMGFLSKLFGGSVGDGVKGALEGAGDLAHDVRSVITGKLPPEEAAKFQQKADELDTRLKQAQLEVNRAEAGHKSIFVAGWRPALGWSGAIAVFYQFVFRPIFVGLGLGDMPEIDTGALWPMIAGMLGLGGMRSWEKGKGVQDKH